MEDLKDSLELISLGIKDCVFGSFKLGQILFPKNKVVREQQRTPRSKNSQQPVKEQPTIWQGYLKCLVLGLIMGLSLYLYPLLVTRFSDLVISFLCPGEELEWLSSITNILFWVFWKTPMFILSRILTFYWYDNIATLICQSVGIDRQVTQSFGENWSEQLLSALVQTTFFFQAYAVLQIACWNEGIVYYLGYCVFILHLALLYSWYAFEYKWCMKGWSFNKRTAYLESIWPYFVGFGIPLAVLTCCFEPYVASTCFFTVFFPITVMTSVVSFSRKKQRDRRPLRAFAVATFLCNYFFMGLIRLCLRLVFGRSII